MGFDTCACGAELVDAGEVRADSGSQERSDGGVNVSNDAGGPPAGAPIILSLSTNTRTVYPNGTLVVTAVVTDPDGIGDVIGGTLSVPDGSATYGAFATSAEEGSYSFTMDWATIGRTEPIVFTTVDGTTRDFAAVFFDASGHRVSQTITVRFDCVGANEVSCETECVDLSTSENHCGECGRSDSRASGCVDGQLQCGEWTWVSGAFESFIRRPVGTIWCDKTDPLTNNPERIIRCLPDFSWEVVEMCPSLCTQDPTPVCL